MVMAAVLVAAIGLSAGSPTVVQAAEITDLTSSFEVGHPFGFNLRLDYLRIWKRAEIRREQPSANGRDYYRTADDISWSQVQNVINLRSEFGIYKDLQLHVQVPIYISSQNQYSFAAGVSQANSTTFADGICQNTVNPNDSPCGQILRQGRFDGQVRKGVPWVGLGITWGVMAQKRDETKPNINLGFEARINVGDPMRAENTSISDGVHRLIWSLTASRRFGPIDPYVGFRYVLPVAASNSLFPRYGQGQDIWGPSQTAAVFAGSEFVVYDRPSRHQKVTLELYGEIEAQFDQRYYSEAWELFARSPALTGRASEFQNAGLFDGVTNIENYYTVTGKVNVNVHMTRYFRFRTGFWASHDSNHLLTYASAGTDVNGDRQVNRSDPNVAPREANPVRRDIIDLPGRRYRLGGSNILTFFVQGAFTY
jgi:hypothetical protein